MLVSGHMRIFSNCPNHMWTKAIFTAIMVLSSDYMAFGCWYFNKGLFSWSGIKWNEDVWPTEGDGDSDTHTLVCTLREASTKWAGILSFLVFPCFVSFIFFPTTTQSNFRLKNKMKIRFFRELVSYLFLVVQLILSKVGFFEASWNFPQNFIEMAGFALASIHPIIIMLASAHVVKLGNSHWKCCQSTTEHTLSTPTLRPRGIFHSIDLQMHVFFY